MRCVTGFGVLGAMAVLAWPAASVAADMRGVTATEIKIGQTMPYSGRFRRSARSARVRSAISRCSMSAAASTAARST